MPRSGRPKLLGKQVYIRLEPEVHEKLDQYIEQHETGPAKVTKSSVINHALKVFLDQQDQQKGADPK